MNPVGRRVAGWRLGTRLFVAQAAVLVAIVVTAGLVAVIVGPPLFHDHLVEAGHPARAEEIPHIEQAFADAGVRSLAAGLLVALVCALAVTWYLTRRIGRPLGRLTDAARRMSTGDYDARVSVTAAGPELATLADSFNQMAERLGNVESTRRRLLSDLAHELRTPIATLNAYLEGLADGVTEWDENTRSILEHQTGRLARLARDLDDVSRAEEGRIALDLSPQPVADLVRHAVEQAQARYQAKGVLLTAATEPGEVVADSQRIAQVLGNLLDNALRHTAAGGRVTVTGRTAGSDQERPGNANAGGPAPAATVTVADTGEGMTDEQLARVFERFYRGDTARTADRGGSGIGLTIARAIAEAHGGTLTAASPGPGGGSTFTLTLPGQSSVADGPAAGSSPATKR